MSYSGGGTSSRSSSTTLTSSLMSNSNNKYNQQHNSLFATTTTTTINSTSTSNNNRTMTTKSISLKPLNSPFKDNTPKSSSSSSSTPLSTTTKLSTSQTSPFSSTYTPSSPSSPYSSTLNLLSTPTTPTSTKTKTISTPKDDYSNRYHPINDLVVNMRNSSTCNIGSSSSSLSSSQTKSSTPAGVIDATIYLDDYDDDGNNENHSSTTTTTSSATKQSSLLTLRDLEVYLSSSDEDNNDDESDTDQDEDDQIQQQQKIDNDNVNAQDHTLTNNFNSFEIDLVVDRIMNEKDKIATMKLNALKERYNNKEKRIKEKSEENRLKNIKKYNEANNKIIQKLTINEESKRKSIKKEISKGSKLNDSIKIDTQNTIKNYNQEMEDKRRKMEEELEKIRRKEEEQRMNEEKKKEEERKKKAEIERLENERLEKERLERERVENERLEKERLEKERVEKERLEKERLEKERLEKERLEKERLENERLEKEKIEKEKLEKEQQQQQQLQQQEQPQLQSDSNYYVTPTAWKEYVDGKSFYNSNSKLVSNRPDSEQKEVRKNINKIINQISANRESIVSKSMELKKILDFTRADDTYYRITLNNISIKIMQQVEVQISANHSLAFPYAMVLINLSRSGHPMILQFIQSHLQHHCIYTVPMYAKKLTSDSNNQYFARIGYKMNDGSGGGGITVNEQEEEFTLRMTGYIALYASIISQALSHGNNIDDIGKHLLESSWKWISRFCNLKARRITSFILLAFLTIAGPILLSVYKNQFVKILQLISTQQFLDSLPNEPGVQSSNARLKQFLEEFHNTKTIKPLEGSTIL